MKIIKACGIWMAIVIPACVGVAVLEEYGLSDWGGLALGFLSGVAGTLCAVFYYEKQL